MSVPEHLLTDLNEAQRLAVSSLEGPTLILAGPGSGKTRVVTKRIAAYIATGRAAPENILAVTFTNKAAAEMRERTAAMLGAEEASRPTISTFHSLCVRILRRHGDRIGLPRAFSILDAADSRTLIRETLADLRQPNEPKDVRAAAAAISRMKSGMPADAGAVGEAYRQRCAKLGAVDFDDLLLLTGDLLKKDAEALDHWRRRYRAIMVDEYQDTNPVQAELVVALAGRGAPDLCVVGDADQAIYGFRNADPRAIDAFLAAYPAARTILLDRNYRSTDEIIAVCNALLAGRTGRSDLHLVGVRGSGRPVRLRVADDDRDEASWVVADAAARAGTAAVLMRTNAQTRPYEEELIRRGERYEVVGSLRFYDRAEIKDALSWLRAATNPDDLVALRRAAGAPRSGVGERTLEEWVGLIEGGRTREEAAAAIDGRGRTAAEKLCARIADVAAAAEHGASAAVGCVLDDIGLIEHHRQKKRQSENDPVANLEELRNAADLAEGVGRAGTEEFLQNAALASAEESEEGRGDGVVLMTVHASKGREFPHVYVSGVEEGLFPHDQAYGPDERDEELRLLYVACSRAEDTLTMTRARRRFLHGEVRDRAASPFLQLVEDVVEVEDGGTLSWRPRGSIGIRTSGAPGVQVRAPARQAGGSDTSMRVSASEISAGDTVEHRKFGPGTVVSVHPEREGGEAVVAFAGTERRLRLDLAPLRKA